ncbi:hypothetical protein Pan44_04470 [Caulifigura coniformis]|uniref:Carboxypeptidase regulatory-like domain-containing protein n=1 Tax=Caulifigura coniformis TaxID=2527983 RepID=A0A517S8I6_9PLAN|nr:hypothetical protein [Caulifigura coniformis]QDT52436.1 hypothetical protein Pan44_04470 [Caulifigura coniformis]
MTTIRYEMLRRARAICLAMTGMVAASGCGSGYPGGAVPVSGVVTLNGVRLDQGTVCFHDATGMTVAIGMVENGSYEMSRTESQKGVIPGSYKVSVMSWIEFPGMTMPNGSVSKGLSRVPQKYVAADTSGLTADVGEDGETIDFAVEGEPEPIHSAAPKKSRR